MLSPGGDDQNLSRILFSGARLADHAADRGIDRKAGEVRRSGSAAILPRPNVALSPGSPPRPPDRAELFQQLGSRRIALAGGALIKGNRSMSPRPDIFIARMTSARLARWNLGLRETRPLEIVRLRKRAGCRPFRPRGAAPLRWSALLLRDRFDRSAPGPRLRRISG